MILDNALLYLIEAEIGLVKIGISAKPETRLRSIALSSPVPVRLIAMWPGSLRDEQTLHAQFEASRTYNEWFRIEGDLAAFIETKRGLGVETIEDWAFWTAQTRLERRKAGRLKASAALKALWATPEYRELAEQMAANRRSAKPSEGRAA